MKTVLVAALALLLATPALASQPVIVVQKGRMFHPDNITIRAGQTIEEAEYFGRKRCYPKGEASHRICSGET